MELDIDRDSHQHCLKRRGLIGAGRTILLPKEMHQFHSEQVRQRYPLYIRVGNYYRKKRFRVFTDVLKIGEDSKILDVGGTLEFWKARDMFRDITLLNISEIQTTGHIKSVVYRGGRFPFADKEFDVVFSNSTLEHVGDFWDQNLFAEEVRRCGYTSFIQVPSFWFPFEPHALIPLFQFLPAPLKIYLRKRFPKSPYPVEELLSIRLLTKAEIRLLFPSAYIFTERLLCLPKSYYIVSKQPRTK